MEEMGRRCHSRVVTLRRQQEILAETYAHSLSSLADPEEFANQVKVHVSEMLDKEIDPDYYVRRLRAELELLGVGTASKGDET